MAERKIGPFILDRQIGVGGMGIVYSAIYPKNQKKVAVKVLAPGLMEDAKILKRFEREIEILKRLNHPHIVKYYGGGADKAQRYYAMEFIDGGSLQQVLKKRKRLSWEHAIQVGRQVSSALEHAHNAGIIHRDLKPANLFMSRKGRLKLGDFGIARDQEATALTAAGKTLGTYAYMAPEQIQVSHPISRKTDIYALGCVMYEIIVGETPFQSDNPMDLLMQHLQDDPYNVIEKVPECPIWLDQLIERMLAKHPDDRPYDALAIHTELGEIRDKVDATNSPAIETSEAGSLPTNANKAKDAGSVVKKKKKKKKKNKDVPFHEQTWFLAACLAGLIAATTWLMWPKGEDWYAESWRLALRGDEYAQRKTLEDHLDKYLMEFPEGKHIAEAREKSDDVHSIILEPQLKNLGRQNKQIEPPFKQECVTAAVLEDKEGLVYSTPWENAPERPLAANPLAAMERWERLVRQSEGFTEVEGEIRWLVRLCRNHHEYFRNKLVTSLKLSDYLRARMLDAEKRFADGDTDSAEATWQYVVDNLSQIEQATLREFGDYAKARLAGEEYPVPDADSASAAEAD